MKKKQVLISILALLLALPATVHAKRPDRITFGIDALQQDDPAAATQESILNPIGMDPISKLVKSGSKVTIVFPDKVKGGFQETSHRKISIPIIIKLSITVYVDLGIIFFSTASLLCLFKWMKDGFGLGTLSLSALFCGLAMPD